MINIEDFFPANYPLQDDPNIQQKIASFDEFNRLKSSAIEPFPTPGELFKHQQVITRLLLIYDRLFILHDAGTGKSCSIIAPMERYILMKNVIADTVDTLTLSQRPIKNIVVIVTGPVLKAEFRRQIACNCTHNKYIPKKENNELPSRQLITRAINDKYKIMTYGELNKAVASRTDEQLHEMFDRTFFYLDEIHTHTFDPKAYIKERATKNAGTKELFRVYDSMHHLFHTIIGSIVCVGTATPMMNSPNEIIPLLNLINNNEMQIPFDTKISEKKYEEFEPYIRGKISYVRALNTGAKGRFIGENITIPVTKAIDDGFIKRESLQPLKPKSMVIARPSIHAKREEVISRTTGRRTISRRTPLSEAKTEERRIIPRRVNIEEERLPRKIGRKTPEDESSIENIVATKVNDNMFTLETKVYPCEMGNFQSEVYEKYSQQLEDDASIKNKDAFYFPSRKASTFVYPNGKIVQDSEIDRDYITVDHAGLYHGTPELKKIIKTNKSKLSTKFYEIFEILNNINGCCFIPSDMARGMGAKIVAMYLEALGATIIDMPEPAFVSSTPGVEYAELDEGMTEEDIDTEQMFGTDYCGTGTSQRLSQTFTSEHQYRKRIVERAGGKYIPIAVITSNTGEKVSRHIKELNNSYENRHGKYLKAIIGSRQVQTGLNLANIICVIVVNPMWEVSSTYQAIQRAIRATGHRYLIDEKIDQLVKYGPNENDIEFMKEQGISNTEIQRFERGMTEQEARSFVYIPIDIYQLVAISQNGDSIEKAIYINAERKNRNIAIIKRMLIKAAIDCIINKDRNFREDDIPGSVECMYGPCVKSCQLGNPRNITIGSYDPKSIMHKIIDYIKNNIHIKGYFTIDELIDLFPSHNPISVRIALGMIANEEIKFTDRFGYQKRLLYDNNIIFIGKLGKGFDSLIYDGAFGNINTIETLPLKNVVDVLSTINVTLESIQTLKREDLATISPKFFSQIFEIIYSENKMGHKYEITDIILKGFKNLYFELNEPIAEIENLPKSKGKFIPKSMTFGELSKPIKIDRNTSPIAIHIVSLIENITTDITSYRRTSTIFLLKVPMRIYKDGEWSDINVRQIFQYNNIVRRLFYQKMFHPFDISPIYGLYLDYVDISITSFKIMDRTSDEDYLSISMKNVKQGSNCISKTKREISRLLAFVHLKLLPFKMLTVGPTWLIEMTDDKHSDTYHKRIDDIRNKKFKPYTYKKSEYENYVDEIIKLYDQPGRSQKEKVDRESQCIQLFDILKELNLITYLYTL